MKKLFALLLVIFLVIFVGVAIAGEAPRTDSSPPLEANLLFVPQVQSQSDVTQVIQSTIISENSARIQQEQPTTIKVEIVGILIPAQVSRVGPSYATDQSLVSSRLNNYKNYTQDIREQMSHYRTSSLGA